MSSLATGARPRPSLRGALNDLPMVTPRPVPSLRAIAAFICGVTVLAAVTYWPQIAHATFYRDDWQFSYSRLAHPRGYFLYGLHEAVVHNRPVYLAINHSLTALFGNDATALLVIGLVITVLTCTAAFVLLSVLGMVYWRAAGLAALLMVYPLADSTRLMWSIATTNVSAGLYFIGATLAIRALVRPPRRSRRLHAVAIVFYLLSLLTYESAAGFIAFSFLLYRLVVPWRAAFSRWLYDISVLGLLFGAFLIANRLFGQHVNSPLALSHLPGRLAVFSYEALGAVALSIFPAGPALVTRLVVAERAAAVLGLIVILIGAYAWLRHRHVRTSNAAVRRWGWTIAAATVALLLAYLPYAIAAGDYHPLERGEGNRTNQLAALPLLVIALGLLMIAWELIVTAFGTDRWLVRSPTRRILAAAPAGALIVASVLTVRGDIGRWQHTANRQSQLQATVTRSLAGDQRRVAVVVQGPLDLFSPGIPHSAPRQVVNLQGTFSVPLGRVLGAEYLIAPGTRFTCGATTMSPAVPSGPVSSYGETLLLRSPFKRPIPINSLRTCLRWS